MSPPPPGASASLGISQSRNHHLDNARFALIVLVVFGHFLGPLIFHPAGDAVYRFIYLFHIPMFAFLSGHVSPTSYRRGSLRHDVRRLILPLLLYQGVYAAAVVALGSNKEVLVHSPFWILWFLLSLFCWRQVLPFCLQLKAPLLLATLIGVGAGYLPYDGYPLSWSRTLVFFPFFVAGALTPRGYFSTPASLPRCLAAGAVVALGLIAARLCEGLDHHWLYGSFGYAELGHPELHAGMYRMVTYLAAASLGWAFLVLTPSVRTPFSLLGRRTMPIYLLHGFVVLIAKRMDLFNGLSHMPVFGQLGIWLAVSFAVAVLLSIRSLEWVVWAPFTLQPVKLWANAVSATRLLVQPRHKAFRFGQR